MLKCILFSTLFLFSFISGAQNLVRNPSFEETDTCYTHCENSAADIIPNAISWFNPTLSTPDIISSCNYTPTNESPNSCLVQYSPFNWRGFQFPFQGNNYSCISMELINIPTNSIISGIREYIGGEFIAPLGTKNYCVSLYLSQASTLYYKYFLNQNNSLYSVVNKIGFNITSDRPFYNTIGSVWICNIKPDKKIKLLI